MATRNVIHLHSRRCPDTVFVLRPGSAGVARDAIGAALYVCDTFAETGSCPRGAACPDAHVPLHNARRLVPHVRDQAQCRAGLCTRYPRYASALGFFTVAQPNAGAASVHVRADECLVTRAIGADGRVSKGVTVLNVCAHFQRKGACDYGAECSFVHPLGAFTPASSDAAMRSVTHVDVAPAFDLQAPSAAPARMSSVVSAGATPVQAPHTSPLVSLPATPHASVPGPLLCRSAASLPPGALISTVALLSFRSTATAQSAHSAAAAAAAADFQAPASPLIVGVPANGAVPLSHAQGTATPPKPNSSRPIDHDAATYPHHHHHHHHHHQPSTPLADPVMLTLTLPPLALSAAHRDESPSPTPPTSSWHARYVHDPYGSPVPGWRRGPPGLCQAA
jgi:hypothetical protein